MSSALTQFDKSGELTWSESITGFTGLQVTDKNGNIFALTSSSVRKYSSDGTFVDSFAFSFTPNDITYGYDGNVYVCGEDATDGHLLKLTTALVEVASKTISSDPAKQIKADVQGNAYVSCASFSIRKFSGALVEIWECEYFTSVPKIVITKNGNMYAAGQAESGGWISTNDPSIQSYWTCSSNCSYDAETDELCQYGFGLKIAIPWGSEWQEYFRPTKFRVIGTLSPGEELSEISLGVGTSSPTEIVHETNSPDLGIEYDIDWSLAPSDGHDINYVKVYASGWDKTVRVSDIQFYAGIETNGIAAISSDGEVTGFIARDTDLQQILIDKSGNLIVKEDDTTISMVSPATGDDVWTYDTGLQINTLITGLHGEIDTNSLAARLEFSADIEIGGNAQQAYVVYPTSKITFSQPTPTIGGHQTNIYPIPGEINFQSNANLMTSVSVTPGAISLNSTPEVIVPVIPEGNIVEFSSPMDTVDILGDLTILKPTGQMQFGTHPETWVFTTDAPGYGPIILIDPPSAGFSSDKIDVNQQTIYSAPGRMDLSGKTFIFKSGDVFASIDGEFPSLELDMFGGAFLQPEFPMFEMDAIGFVGHNAELSLIFPSLSIESYAGGYVDVTMPSFEFVMEATITGLAEISLTFPALGFSISAELASEGDINISLPGLQMAMEATAGIVGELTLRFPRLGMTGTLLAGATGQIEGSFRIMDMSMSASPIGPGTISAEFPSLEMLIQSGAIEADVLRYNWERVT